MIGQPLKNALAAFFLFSSVVQAQNTPAEEPDDYRQEHYRAPVPATLKGGTVIDDETAYEIWESGQAVFVDVVPRPPKPPNLPEDTIWHEKPHFSIPGAIWLPNVGYGRIARQTDAYFRAGLEKATKGSREKPVVIFCLADCWMSWNAAKRAIEEYGYTNVYWYPYGTDGWTLNNYPTENIMPEPLAAQD